MRNGSEQAHLPALEIVLLVRHRGPCRLSPGQPALLRLFRSGQFRAEHDVIGAFIPGFARATASGSFRAHVGVTPFAWRDTKHRALHRTSGILSPPSVS